MKISAIDFSLAGDKYLGRSYEEMDCQAFVEKCMADVGLRMDLGGSNSWYRECGKHGWVGTPEECVKEFGSVPKGALLFILEPVGPKTPAKFRNDGIGDVTHMGIVTGRGDGAIHSSSSRGCVATSKFKGKTIPNGGWNRVGLYDKFDYGTTANWVLDHIGLGGMEQGAFRMPPPVADDGGETLKSYGFAGTGEPDSTQAAPWPAPIPFQPSQQTTEEETTMNVIIRADNDGPVKLRQSSDPKRGSYSIWEEIPSGTKAEVLQFGEEWSRIRVGNRTGWMMSRFLIADDSDLPAEPELTEDEPEETEPVTDESRTLLSEVYRILRDLCEKIESVVGEG